jgi:diazepam-binding inhibitor (GABA receptor modulating acyl-CoA-binding protein)
MSNSSEFINATEVIKQYNSYLTITDFQKLYGYYKQAVIGDINIEKPSFFNFKECKKWESWNDCKGMTKYDAEIKYILYVNEILSRQPALQPQLQPRLYL